MKIYVFIAVMALTTYLIRALPLTLFQKPIQSRFVQSFLTYVPVACLSCMTFPAILTATNTLISGIAALAVGLIAAFFRRSLVTVAVLCSLAVFVTEWVIRLL